KNTIQVNFWHFACYLGAIPDAPGRFSQTISRIYWKTGKRRIAFPGKIRYTVHEYMHSGGQFMQFLFSPDSKIMQFLSRLYDIAVLNLLFLVTCVPLVTIGA